MHGIVTIRIPRLARSGSNLAPPVLLSGKARRRGAEHAHLLARLGAWMSFRDAEALVSTLFPMARGAAEATIRRRVRGGAALIVGSKDEASASPAAAIDIGIDTTFIRSCAPKPRHHEVLLGCATTDDGRSRRIGAVLDVVEQPHALVAGALDAVGRGEDTAVSAFTDGDRMLRSLLVSAGVDTPPILDWPHIARKLQAAIASERRLRSIGPREQAAHEEIRALLSRLRWRLWHGKTAKAVRALDGIERRLQEFGVDLIRPKWTASQARKLLRHVVELRDYVSNQGNHLVDYAAHRRRGETISTASSESLANALVNRRMNKLQQMRWSALGAHAVLTIRSDTTNRETVGAYERRMSIAA